MSPSAALLVAIGATLLGQWLMQMTVAVRDAASYDLVNNFACQLLAHLAAIFAVLRFFAPEASIRVLLGFRPTHPGFYPLAIAIGAAITVPASVVYSLLLRKWPDPNDDGRLAVMFSEAATPKRILIALTVIAFVPLLEEVFFRGALFGPQRRRSDPVTVVMVTAGLFALAHLTPQRFVPIFLVGIAMGVVRAASGSIIPTVLLHATFNAIPFYSMTTGLRPDDAAKEPLPYALAAALAVGAIGLVYGAHLLGKRSEAAASARDLDLR